MNSIDLDELLSTTICISLQTHYLTPIYKKLLRLVRNGMLYFLMIFGDLQWLPAPAAHKLSPFFSFCGYRGNNPC